MKQIVLAALIMMVAACQPAFASACYTLTGDAQRVCLAIERKDRSMCYAVQDTGERAKCLAMLASGG